MLVNITVEQSVERGLLGYRRTALGPKVFSDDSDGAAYHRFAVTGLTLHMTGRKILDA